MNLENPNIDRFFQFCENFQETCNAIIETQTTMSEQLINLIRPNTNIRRSATASRRTTPIRTYTRRRNAVNRTISPPMYNFTAPRRTTAAQQTQTQTQAQTHTQNPFSNFSRVYTFPVDINNVEADISNNMGNIFRNMFNDANNGFFNNNSFFSNVPVVPTQEQINQACETINYSTNLTYNQRNCPISLTTFRDGQEVMRIRYCGHIFVPSHLRQWFSLNTRCPVCRYDIRNYTQGNTMDTSNIGPFTFDTSTNTTDSSSSSIVSPINVNNNTSSVSVVTTAFEDMSINDVSVEDVSSSDNLSDDSESQTDENLNENNDSNDNANDTSNNNVNNSVDNLNNILVHAIEDILNPGLVTDTSMNQTLLNFQYSIFDPNNIR